jgi:hypothetical protein
MNAIKNLRNIKRIGLQAALILSLTSLAACAPSAGYAPRSEVTTPAAGAPAEPGSSIASEAPEPGAPSSIPNVIGAPAPRPTVGSTGGSLSSTSSTLIAAPSTDVRQGGEPPETDGSRVPGAPEGVAVEDQLGDDHSFANYRAAQLNDCPSSYPNCVKVVASPASHASDYFACSASPAPLTQVPFGTTITVILKSECEPDAGSAPVTDSGGTSGTIAGSGGGTSSDPNLSHMEPSDNEHVRHGYYGNHGQKPHSGTGPGESRVAGNDSNSVGSKSGSGGS